MIDYDLDDKAAGQMSVTSWRALPPGGHDPGQTSCVCGMEGRRGPLGTPRDCPGLPGTARDPPAHILCEQSEIQAIFSSFISCIFFFSLYILNGVKFLMVTRTGQKKLIVILRP